MNESPKCGTPLHEVPSRDNFDRLSEAGLDEYDREGLVGTALSGFRWPGSIVIRLGMEARGQERL